MVRINGIELNADGLTIAEFLAETDYNPKRVAVERNGEIIPKSKYKTTAFSDGDNVEIVSFVGGG